MLAKYEDINVRFVKWVSNDVYAPYCVGENTCYFAENITVDKYLEFLNIIKPLEFNPDKNRNAQISEERWTRFLKEYPNAYVAKIPIQQFLDMTTVNDGDKRGIYSQSTNISKSVPVENIRRTFDDYMYLKIDFDSMSVTDHNGRHRMTAMLKEGIYSADVFIIPENDYFTDYHENLRIKGQFNDKVHNLTLLRAKSELYPKTVNRMFRTDKGEFQYSRKTKPISEGSVHSRVAEVEKLRVYDKRDAEKIISTVMSEVMMFDEYEYGELNATNKREATKQLWERLNAALTDKDYKKRDGVFPSRFNYLVIAVRFKLRFQICSQRPKRS